MIIWSGWGILIALAALAVLAGVDIATSSALGAGFYADHVWPKLVSWLLAAAVVWPIARWLDSRPGRHVIDKATGRQLVLRRRDSLFFIPARYWPFIIAGLGVVIAGAQLLSGLPL